MLAFSVGSIPAWAQYETDKQATVPLEYFYVKRKGTNLFRTILTKFTFGLSTGYGRSYFKHSLDDFGLLQNPGERPIIFASATSPQLSNWFNTLDTTLVAPQAGNFTINPGTESFGFKGKGFSIPLKATIHYEWKRFRIGGGYSYEYLLVGNFKPTEFENQIGEFSPDVKGGFMKKYFGMIGAAVYRYEDYLLVADAQIGGFKPPKKSFNPSKIQKGIYYNVGATIERDLSEYFKLFVRPSFEFKNFTLNVPESGQGIKHRFNAFYLNVGATYRFPELRKCFLKDCKAQLNHAHGNKEYRSRMHPIYKKQNPNYGENYPSLLKYKGRNKKKLSPY